MKAARVLRFCPPTSPCRLILGLELSGIVEGTEAEVSRFNSGDEVYGATNEQLTEAYQTLIQARDRLAAGVTDNIEVVQAQQSVASADESLISSLYSYNVSKVELGRAIGNSEAAVQEYLKGR